MEAMRDIRSDDLFDIVRRPSARFSALNIYYGAERTSERAASAGVKAGRRTGGQVNAFGGQERCRGTLQIRQLAHEIVDRREVAVIRNLHHLTETAFRFSRENADAHIERFLNVRIAVLEHCERAGNMKAAHRHPDAFFPQRSSNIERAWELIRLHADEHHDTGAGFFDQLCDSLRPYDCVRFVESVNFKFDILA